MHSTRALSLGLITLFALSAPLSAQQRFALRKPPKRTEEVMINMRFMQPADVTFGNLGNIDGFYRAFAAGTTSDDPSTGWPSYINTDIQFDSSYYDADGNFVPPNDDPSTWTSYNVAFANGAEQLFMLDSSGNLTAAPPAPPPGGTATGDFYLRGTVIRGYQVDDMGTPTTFQSPEESDMGIGWEVQYARYVNEKRRLGLIAAFGVNGIHTETQQSWKINAQGDYYYHGINDAAIGIDGSYQGSPEVPVIFLPGFGRVQANIFPNLSLTETGVDLGTDINASGSWEIDSGFYAFRLGGIYNLGVTRRVDMRLSAGLHATLVSTRLGWSEIFTLNLYESGTAVPVTDSGDERDLQFIWGAWADAGASWRINDRTSFFGSVEYQTSDTMSVEASDGSRVDFDTSALLFAKTGFNWSF